MATDPMLVGGPSDGHRVRLPGSIPLPPFVCSRPAGAFGWHHYEPAADATYRHVGPCDEIDHGGCSPHDHEPEC